MDNPSSFRTHQAQEVKAIRALSKQTFTAAKFDKSSVGTSRVGNISVSGDTDHSLTTSTLTLDPFGDDQSPKYAAEDPTVSISRRSLSPVHSIATVADSPSTPAIQTSLPAPRANHSSKGDGTSLHHQAERGSSVGDIFRHLSVTSPIAAAEEDLEMTIVPVRNPSSRQATDPTITSLTPSPRIVTSAATVEDPAPQQVDPKVDLIEGQTQIKRKFRVQTILGIVACIVSVVGAVATVYAAFHHGSSS